MLGCECWTLTKDLERRLEAADIWYIRRRMRTSWTEKKLNEEIIEMAGYKDPYPNPSDKDNYTMLGHINRADGLEKQYIEWKDMWYQKAEEDNAQNTQTV